jgi:hypothetical protein
MDQLSSNSFKEVCSWIAKPVLSLVENTPDFAPKSGGENPDLVSSIILANNARALRFLTVILARQHVP